MVAVLHLSSSVMMKHWRWRWKCKQISSLLSGWRATAVTETISRQTYALLVQSFRTLRHAKQASKVQTCSNNAVRLVALAIGASSQESTKQLVLHNLVMEWYRKLHSEVSGVKDDAAQRALSMAVHYEDALASQAQESRDMLTKLQAVAIERGQLMDRAKEIQGTLETVRANEVRLRNRIQELEQTSEMVRFVLWFIYV